MKAKIRATNKGYEVYDLETGEVVITEPFSKKAFSLVVQDAQDLGYEILGSIINAQFRLNRS